MNMRLLIGGLVLSACSLSAQTIVEARVANSHYRFLDVSYNAKSGAVLDGFYVGVPGSNELNLGGGYTFKQKALSLTPLLYAVAGKEGGERGVKVAVLAAVDSNGWKLNAFAGAFLRVSGSTDSYQVLDTLDLTRALTQKWELGVQSGFFHAAGDWNMQVGPLLKLNDARGAWAASYRWGHPKEFRIGRVLVF